MRRAAADPGGGREAGPARRPGLAAAWAERPRLRDRRFLYLLGGTWAAARLMGGDLPNALFLLLALALGLGYLACLAALRGTRSTLHATGSRLWSGEVLAVELHLENRSLLPAALLADVPPAAGEGPANLLAGGGLEGGDSPGSAWAAPLWLGPRSSQVLARRTSPLRRGLYRVGPLRLTARDPFGLFEASRLLTLETPVVVLPRLRPLASPPFQARARQGRQRERSDARRDLSDPAGVRPYQPGDNPRHIHWKVSAKRGRLFLREFDRRGTGPLHLLLDLREKAYAGREGPDLLEAGIEAALSWAEAGLRLGGRVLLSADGAVPHRLGPYEGPRSVHLLLEATVRLSADGRRSLAESLRSLWTRLPGGSTVAVFTPVPDAPLREELLRLRAAGHRAFLIRIDPGGASETVEVGGIPHAL